MKPGSRVICVDDSINGDRILETVNMYHAWPTKGHRYTVRKLLHNDGIVTGVLLEELRNPEIFIRLIGRVQEPAFATWRFRELMSVDLQEVEELAEVIR